MPKSTIIGVLGEDALLLPEAVNRALAANDRVKCYFTVLQAARQQAEDPNGPRVDLRAEREASGAGEPFLDEAVRGARRTADGAYHIPRIGAVHALIATGLAEMIAPLALAAGSGRPGAEEAGAFARRRDALLERLAPGDDDRVDAGYLGAMTHARRGRGDSAHLLVMDLHKALNALQGALSTELLDGALVYGLDEADRPLVRAFMRGLNRTAPLKFDHPGLGTTATRSGERLVIQNDIGTTDAHVLVVRVEGLTLTLTYTDIHLRRARFFQGLFEDTGLRWGDLRSRRAEGLEEGDAYYLCVGVFEAEDADALVRHLDFLASRIVFLIDWNRARKRLRLFTGNGNAVRLLEWAARHDLGHRAFLQLGGERLVFEAIERAASVPLRYGERLDALLGRERVTEYLRFVLRTCAESLTEGRSEQLVLDELRAELLKHFRTPEQEALGLLGEHAALVVELAGGVRDALMRDGLGDDGAVERAALRAKHWESLADRLVNRIRETAKRSRHAEAFGPILDAADDAADDLEEAAHLLTLWHLAPPGAALRPTLLRLAQLVLEGTFEFVKCVESARHVQRAGAREDTRDFLRAVDGIVRAERRTDTAEREVVSQLVAAPADARAFHVVARIAQALEGTADALSHAAYELRDHVMGEVMSA